MLSTCNALGAIFESKNMGKISLWDPEEPLPDGKTYFPVVAAANVVGVKERFLVKFLDGKAVGGSMPLSSSCQGTQVEWFTYPAQDGEGVVWETEINGGFRDSVRMSLLNDPCGVGRD